MSIPKTIPLPRLQLDLCKAIWTHLVWWNGFGTGLLLDVHQGTNFETMVRPLIEIQSGAARFACLFNVSRQ